MIKCKKIMNKILQLGDGSGEDEEELKQITVKFARQESEKTRKAREKSFGYVNQMNSKETWYTSNFYSKRSDRSEVSVCFC